MCPPHHSFSLSQVVRKLSDGVAAAARVKAAAANTLMVARRSARHSLLPAAVASPAEGDEGRAALAVPPPSSSSTDEGGLDAAAFAVVAADIGKMAAHLADGLLHGEDPVPRLVHGGSKTAKEVFNRNLLNRLVPDAVTLFVAEARTKGPIELSAASVVGLPAFSFTFITKVSSRAVLNHPVTLLNRLSTPCTFGVETTV
jgi:hypothetical protein